MSVLRPLRLHLAALLLAFLLLPAACGGDSDESSDDDDATPGTSASPTTEASPADRTAVSGTDEVRYLAIGDSLSQGVGGDDIETQAFPARLAERWREAGCTVELYNAGISGYTAGQMISDQLPHIAEFGPTLITFQSGANDIANGVTEDEYRANVGTVLDAAVESGARVYVLLQNEWFRAPQGPNYGGTRELRDAYDAIMIEEAGSRDVEVLDLRPIYEQQADNDEWVDDGIHPTADAYDAWAEELASLIPRPCDN